MNFPRRRPIRYSCVALLFACVPSLCFCATVKTGLDVLEAKNFEPLRGKRIGVITNHTGVDSNGRSIIDLLAEAPGVTLAAIFSPEHGFAGKARDGVKIADARWKGVPLYSLYGKTQRPTAEMLEGLDALVFDIQDIGTRFYTYITTMGYAMEEAAKKRIDFYVLDRPNPITGRIVEGETLEPSVRHFTAHYSIPTRHGLTVGELARWYNDYATLNARLTVIPMEGWKRGWWDETGLRFIPTSPNIPTPETALLYPGVGAFEATNVSVGRGTKTPFQIFGAPWLNGRELAQRLNAAGLAGVAFEPIDFTPNGDNLYAREQCHGVRIIVKDRESLRVVDIFVHAACIIRDLSDTKFILRWEEVPRVVGFQKFQEMYQTGTSPEKILADIHESAEEFMKAREPYLLYGEK